ncbi:unnamed protein product [Ambrosiozyma monospora]|uniref:Unnamed protein product n=2 Tax=Ambrosiozyma monospora TaxID=43982 RepID=A0ACB5U5R0_AMBMO|nr:unnamed protein product [Ambrosiozyma monospora]
MPLGRSAKHLNLTLRNLASSLIQYESITTTQAKAKLTQKYIEHLITKTKRADQSNPEQLAKVKELLRGHLYNHDITLPKMLQTFPQRYANRVNGYTRILKLENRIGDNAPQCIIEMVDNGSHEMRFWITAKTVARLELQGLPLDHLTEKNMKDLLLRRENGEAVFRDAVETCKKEFFGTEEQKKELKTLLPRIKGDKSGYHKSFTNYVVVPRPSKNGGAGGADTAKDAE